MKHIKLFESISEKLYHGNRKGDFPPEKKRFAGAIFLTSNLEFAKDFAGFNEKDEFPNGAVWEVELKEKVNLCDPMEIKTMVDLDLKGVIQKMINDKYVDEASGTKFNEVAGSGFKGYDPDTDEEFDIKDKSESAYFYLWRIKNGAWRIIECNPIIEKIKQSGFDGFYVTERGSKNVAVFDEKSIKSFEKIPEFSGSDSTEIKEGNSTLVLDWNKNITNTGNMRHIKEYSGMSAKHLEKFALFEARISKGAIFSPAFLSNFKHLSSLIYEECVGEINKVAGEVTIDYATKGEHSLIVIKVNGAEDVVIDIMGIIEPGRKMTRSNAEWMSTAEIASDDLMKGLESDSDSVHKCLNSIAPGFSSSPGEFVDKLAAVLFYPPVEFKGSEKIYDYTRRDMVLANAVKDDIQGAWPNQEKMQNYIYTRKTIYGNIGMTGVRELQEPCMEGICRNFFTIYLPNIFQLISNAKLQSAKTGRAESNLDVSDLFKSEMWKELEALGWTNSSTERMLKNKSISLQNGDLGLNGGVSGSISISSSGYVRKIYPADAWQRQNSVLKKFPPFSKLEDYHQAFEYLRELSFKNILSDAGLKVTSKKLNSLEDIASYLMDLYKKGEIEPIARAWEGLPQSIKDLAVDMSGEPDFEREVKAFGSFRNRII